MKSWLPGQNSGTRARSENRGEETAKITVVTSVDFRTQTITTRELTVVNGQLARLTPDTDPTASGAVPVPTVPVVGLPIYSGASTTGNDTYTATVTPTLTALTDGVIVLLRVNAAITAAGGSTFDASGTGAKDIKCPDFNTGAFNHPGDNKVLANDIILLVYDATNDHWRLCSVYRA